MRRVAFVLTVLGILCVAAGQAQAHDYYHHGGHHGGYYGGIRDTVVVRPPVFVTPQFVVPVLAPRAGGLSVRLVYPPVYGYRYFDAGARASACTIKAAGCRSGSAGKRASAAVS